MSPKPIAALVFLCFTTWAVYGKSHDIVAALSSTGKPLIKRPPGRNHTTVLAVDGGGVRGIFAAAVLEEVEQSIKRYLLNHPHLLLPHVNLKTVDDFDINLVDYFDCMTAFSGGSWSVLYLASRGGQGAAQSFLQNPDIVAKYGPIPLGGARGLRPFYREYSSKIYPLHSIDMTAGTPFDVTNPGAPGVLSPLFSLDSIERSLEVLLGDTTLEDVDTSLLIPALDLASGLGISFVQNKFKTPSVTSAAKLTVRSGPRDAPVNGTRFKSDFIFEEGKNYYLKDVGTAASTVPAYFPAKNVSQVGNDTVEFSMIDGFFPIEAVELPANAFIVNEKGLENFESIATLSVGSGRAVRDLSVFANAGALGWLGEGDLLNMYIRTSFDSLATLVDYMYYGNPDVKPYQYLRVQDSAPVTTEEGMAYSVSNDASFLDIVEQRGETTAKAHRDSIDAFVRDFVFA